MVLGAYSLGLVLRTLDRLVLDPVVGDPSGLWYDLVRVLPVIVLVHILANVIAGAYGHVWEYASTSEAARVVFSNAGAFGVLVVLNWVLRQIDGIVVPYSVLVVGALVSLFTMGLVRFRSRLFSIHKTTGAIKVLVVGTDREAAAFARQALELDSERRVVGFVADNRYALANGDRRLAGLEVLGELSDIASVVEEHDIDEVVVVGGGVERVRRVVDLCIDVEVRLRLQPGVEDVMREEGAAVDVRDIRVEDVLVRQQVETDLSQVEELIQGKRVLVTGAGGSIGSEIVRQVLCFQPQGIWALDRDETLLHDARLHWPGDVELELVDIRDTNRLIRICERVKPQIVFHAAALKHVPLLENHPEEAVLTNVVGTRNLIEAGSRSGMETFVLISTDKAVEPESVMGATKRLAEMMTQVGGERRDGCVYTAVRFGNVLGSRGSVIPTFVEQIQAGGPVTVTDPGMTRYFMTVAEAVQLVLQASALARGSEVFLLDMGEPVRIEDLARRLIRLAGLTPGKDIDIRFTGRRPGEKLSEILAAHPLQPTSHNKVFEVQLSQPHAPHTLMGLISELEESAMADDRERVLSLLSGATESSLRASVDQPVALDEDAPVAAWS